MILFQKAIQLHVSLLDHNMRDPFFGITFFVTTMTASSASIPLSPCLSAISSPPTTRAAGMSLCI